MVEGPEGSKNVMFGNPLEGILKLVSDDKLTRKDQRNILWGLATEVV